MDKLGNTLAEIAGEKGAIVKQNIPVVSAQQLPEARDVIKKIAREKKAPLYFYGKDINATLIGSQLKGNYFDYRGISNKIDNLFVPLAGDFQLENTSLAIATAELLDKNGFIITQNDIISGVKNSQWPGRFEIVREKPLVILDGGHNPNGARQFIKNLKALVPDRKIIAVLGVFRDKDYSNILKIIVPQVNEVILTMADNPRATPTEILAEEVRHYIDDKNIIETNDVTTAINKAFQVAGEDDVICITGSLYTVGEAKAYFVEEENRKG